MLRKKKNSHIFNIFGFGFPVECHSNVEILARRQFLRNKCGPNCRALLYKCRLNKFHPDGESVYALQGLRHFPGVTTSCK